jgi:hypothetical protein
VPGREPSAHARTIARAAEVLGGIAELSEFVHVPQEALMRWIRDEETPAPQAFQQIVAVLLDFDLGKFKKKPGRPKGAG